jgi:hypothetical protein
MGFYGRQWKVPGWQRLSSGFSTGSGKLLHFWLTGSIAARRRSAYK